MNFAAPKEEIQRRKRKRKKEQLESPMRRKRLEEEKCEPLDRIWT